MSDADIPKKVYCPSCTDEVVPVTKNFTSRIENARHTTKKVCPSCMYVFASTQIKRSSTNY